MKKSISISLLIMFIITGCSNIEISTSLEDFYLQSIIEQTEDTSLKEAKESLKNFDYEYKLEEYSKQYSKEEIESFEKEFGEKFEISDISYNTFSDKNSNIEIVFNETDKKITSSSYTLNEENIKKTINKMNDTCSINISGDNIKYIHEIIDRLNLSEKTNKGVNLYFQIVNSMKNNKNITIKDIQEILNSKYTKRKEEFYGDNYYIYTFKMGDGDMYIEANEENGEVVKLEMQLGISDYVNYLVSLTVTNKDIFTKEKGFNLEMNMNSNLIYNMFDKPQNEIKEASKPINKELFEFAYRNGKLKYYTDEYDENKTDIIETRYNKEEKAYVINPNENRVVNESLYGIDDKVLTIKLNKSEKINLDINTEKEIEKPIKITLMDVSNDKVIFEKEINSKSKNTISTKQVDKDGEYKLVFDIDNLDNYNIKIIAIKTNKQN